MVHRRFIAIFFLLLMALTASPVATASTVRVHEWVVIQIEGTAEFRRNSPNWSMLRRGDTVVSGYEIRTGPNAKVLLARGSETITIEPKSALEFLPPGKDSVTRIFQKFGGAIFNIRKRYHKHFEVLTPHLAATVKGTEFTIRSDSNGARLSVTEGTVGVTNKKSGKSIDVTSGQFAMIAANGGAIATGDSAVRTRSSLPFYASVVAVVSVVLGVFLIVYVAVMRRRTRAASPDKATKKSVKR